MYEDLNPNYVEVLTNELQYSQTVDQLLEEARLGIEAQKFLASNIGRQILKTVLEEKQRAITSVEGLQPGAEMPTDLYLKLHLPELFLDYLSEIIKKANYALNQLEMEGDV